MITRNIGKILLGNVTPFQIIITCVLGSMIGFLPGFTQASGLLIVLVVLLIFLNTNLALAVWVGFIAKLLSLLLMPVSFSIGRLFIDGPTHGLLTWITNAPVLALFGLEYYVTTGCIPLGLAFGLMVGIPLAWSVIKLKKKILTMKTGTMMFEKLSSKLWTRMLMFVFIGGISNKDKWIKLLDKRVGNPVRPAGAVFAGIVVVVLAVLYFFSSGPIITAALRNGLERVNGATVDLTNASVDLSEGRMTFEGFAMSNPDALDTNLFSAERIEVDISTSDLLRKRLKLDRVAMVNAAYGSKRSVPGRIVGASTTPTDTGPKPGADDTDEGGKSIEDYIENAKVWKERLATIRKWLEAISGPGKESSDGPTGSFKDWLEREIQKKGYANVAALHLIEEVPKLSITEIIADKVSVSGFGNETIDILSINLSTHPHLSDRIPGIEIKSSDNRLHVNINLSGTTSAGGENIIEFSYRGLDVDKIVGQLNIGGDKLVSGGTFDVEIAGNIDMDNGIYLNLPVKITLHNSIVTVPGIGPASVQKMVFPIKIQGQLDDPRIVIDQSLLSKTLAETGKEIITGKLKDEAGKFLENAMGKQLDGETKGDAVDRVKNKAKSFLDGIFKRREK